MKDAVTIGRRRVMVGDCLIANDNAEYHEICRSKTEVKIHCINRNGDETLLGLYSENPLSGWHDLEGQVPNRHGYWATRDCLIDNFSLKREDYTIKEDTVFKGVSLKGMSCRLLHVNKRGLCFVELDKNVGGGSADGLGKKGHCVVMHKSALEAAETKDKKKAFTLTLQW
jgi:hypothetical protein